MDPSMEHTMAAGTDPYFLLLMVASTLATLALIWAAQHGRQGAHARLWAAVGASVALGGLGGALTAAGSSYSTAAQTCTLAAAVVGAATLAAVLVMRRALRGPLVVDAGIIGTALAVCLVVDPPLAMLGGVAATGSMGSMEPMGSMGSMASMGSMGVNVASGASGLAVLAAVVTVVLAVGMALTLISSDLRLPCARACAGAATLLLVSLLLDQLHLSFHTAALSSAAHLAQAVALLLLGCASMLPGHDTIALPVGSRGPDALAWSRPRLVVVLASFLVPVYCLATHESLSATVAELLAGLLLMVLLLAMRAATAVAAMTRITNELEYRAGHDALTGLPNRATLNRYLDATLGGTVATAVYFVDLNGFKMVNDSLGHAAGDQLLRTVAGRLRDGLPASLAVARIGGDEFVVVESAPVDCEQTAARVRALGR